jgi:glycosyltransferase involved in cell wall biosynthesis
MPVLNPRRCLPLTTTASDGEGHPGLSVIVPAYNGGTGLTECLEALRGCAGPEREVLVVDDASTDDTAAQAEACGVRVIRLPRNHGPAGARNEGAQKARGDVLFFVDADVVLAPDALQRVTKTLGDPTVAATFGSYDAHPRAPGIVSQYRNLLHHFVHQTSRYEASTFWAGCGAVRRAVFAEVGGFDASRYENPSIEDIELGCRLRRAGHRIVLDKQLLGTHLKRWTLRSMVSTDLWRRAVPWSRLIFERKEFPTDLNLKAAQRVSVALTGLAVILLALSVWRSGFLLAATVAVAVVIALNWGFFEFLMRERGVAFAAACMPLHLLHHLCSGLGFVVARLELLAAGRLAVEPGLPAGRSTPNGR